MLSLDRLLMSRVFQRYIECLIVVWCPWVLFLEQEAQDFDFRIEGGNLFTFDAYYDGKWVAVEPGE